MKKICFIVLLGIVMLSGCGSAYKFVGHNRSNYFKPVGDQQDVQGLKQCLNSVGYRYLGCTRRTRFGFDSYTLEDMKTCQQRMQAESKWVTGSMDSYGKTELGRKVFHDCMIEKGYIYLSNEE